MKRNRSTDVAPFRTVETESMPPNFVRLTADYRPLELGLLLKYTREQVDSGRFTLDDLLVQWHPKRRRYYVWGSTRVVRYLTGVSREREEMKAERGLVAGVYRSKKPSS